MNSESKSVRTIKLFRTAPHSCSYLPGQQASTLFVDPNVEITRSLNTQLSDLGFRRSGSHIYKPECVNCRACLSCRVLVDGFEFSRRHKRLLNRNQDIVAREVTDINCDESFNLYCKYIHQRHADGDMYPPNREQFESFLTVRAEGTRFFKFSCEGSLQAVSIMDQLQHGLSAVYTYFDPEQSRRSLGNYVILWQILQAREMQLPYLYLGYWVKDCKKMNYKSAFRPLDVLVNGNWVTLNN